MKKTTIAASLMLLASHNSHAYLAEIDAFYFSRSTTSEYRDGSKSDSDTSAIGTLGKVYFSQVDSTNVPFNEAAFLSRTGYVGLAGVKGENEYDNGAVSRDFDAKVLAARGIFGSFIIDGYYAREIEQADSSGEGVMTRSAFGLGGYINKSSAIIVSLVKEKFEIKEGSYRSVSSQNKGISTTFKLHTPLRNQQALSVGGTALLSDSEKASGAVEGFTFSLDLFAEYYLSRQLSLTANLDTEAFASSNTSYDYGGDITNTRQAATFGVQYYVTDGFSIYSKLSVSASTWEVDGDETSTHSTQGMDLGVKFRF